MNKVYKIGIPNIYFLEGYKDINGEYKSITVEIILREYIIVKLFL